MDDEGRFHKELALRIPFIKRRLTARFHPERGAGWTGGQPVTSVSRLATCVERIELGSLGEALDGQPSYRWGRRRAHRDRGL